MRNNPFYQTEAPAWLSAEPTHQIPHLLRNLLELAEYVPDVYETLPWLKKMNVWYLILERMSDEPEASQEATFTRFFANVTRPAAEMIEALYLSPHMRRVSIVTEILRRMAQSSKVPALPLDVVAGVCYSFWHRRASILSEDPIRVQGTTWFVGWWQSSVYVHSPQGTMAPFLILVIDETTSKILAFRSTHAPPEGTDLLLTLYDALVFPSDDRWHLHPPARICIPCPVLPEFLRAGKAWQIEVEEVIPQECAFLRQWEDALEKRTLDATRYVRIFDRACEHAFGYAPLRAKQQVAHRLGRRWRVDDDPAWFVPSLREVLPVYEASIGSDGTLEWRGWHYREKEHDLLRYWPHERVTLRPSPSSEALIWIYWKQEILCEAVAEELCHKDGTYHPYWFPYPRLGE
jgi:hypothetical protein